MLNFAGNLIFWAIGSCFTAEFLGYLLYRLLHSDKIRILSRSHMEHHLKHYGPRAEQRPEGGYVDATGERPAIGNVGLEWLVPGAVLLFGCVLVLNLHRVYVGFQITFIAFAIAWSFVTFSYVHDGFHVEKFWMAKNPLLRGWFLKARLRHDYHHEQLNEKGLMDKNFGIALSIFDRIFRTHLLEAKLFNQEGHKAAIRRYSYLGLLHTGSGETR